MSLISAEIFDWEEVEITWLLEFYNKIKVKRVSTFMDDRRRNCELYSTVRHRQNWREMQECWINFRQNLMLEKKRVFKSKLTFYTQSKSL